MILKAFKEKSNQKYINRLLNAASNRNKHSIVKSVGVVLNVDEFTDVEVFNRFFKELGLQEANTKIVSFAKDPKTSNELWGAYFNVKHIGWNGKINHPDLQQFVNTAYDVLICFYKSNHVELDVIAASSKAHFKVGISPLDARLYDLIIAVETSQFSLFKQELNKYLTVLNKL